MNYNKYLLEYQTYIGKNGKTKYRFDSPEEKQAYINYRKASKAYYGNLYDDKKELRDDDREDFLSYKGNVKGLNRQTEYLNKGIENRKRLNNSEEENDDKPKKKDAFAPFRKGYVDPNSKNEEENDDKGRSKRQPGENAGDYRKRLNKYNAEQQQKYEMEREQQEQREQQEKQKQKEESERRFNNEMEKQRQMIKNKKIKNLKKASIIGGTAVAAGIAGKIAFDRIQYNKFKKKHPKVSYKQWKAMRKKSLHESFNEGYQAALEEFYY